MYKTSSDDPGHSLNLIWDIYISLLLGRPSSPVKDSGKHQVRKPSRVSINGAEPTESTCLPHPCKQNAVSECPRNCVIGCYYYVRGFFDLPPTNRNECAHRPIPRNKGTNLPSGLATVPTLDCIAPIDQDGNIMQGGHGACLDQVKVIECSCQNRCGLDHRKITGRMKYMSTNI